MIFHITTYDLLEAAREQGQYSHDSLEAEGFLHFSTIEQVIPVANTKFLGQSNLVLLAVNENMLKAELVYEENVAPYGEIEVFPHLYGTLNMDAVKIWFELPVNFDGTFTLPDDVHELLE